LSIGAVSLFVFFGATTIVVVIPILVWLFRDLRRIGPVQPASGSKEEDSPTGSRRDQETKDRSLNQQACAVPPTRDFVPEAKMSRQERLDARAVNLSVR
jgi:hypothetical protein